MADQTLGQVQPFLLQQGFAAEPAVPLQDGLAEAVRSLVAHLHRTQDGAKGQNWGLGGSPDPFPSQYTPWTNRA